MSPRDPHPDCPICKGLGWYESPYYSDFEPKTVINPCPECVQVEPVSVTFCALLAVAVAVMIFLAAWGGK